MMFDDTFPDDDLLHGGPLSPTLPGRYEPRGEERLFLLQKPAMYLASNLFAAYTTLSRRTMYTNLVLHSLSHRVAYSGQRLDQRDLDTLLVLLDSARESGLKPGRPFRTTMERLERAWGLEPGRTGADEHPRESLFRLESARLLIQDSHYSYYTRLVNKVLFNHADGGLVVELDHAMQKAFQRCRRFPLLLRERRALSGTVARNSLMRWLHALAWVLDETFCADAQMLYRLSGRIEMQSMEEFRTDLDRALEGLSAASLLTLSAPPLPDRRVLTSGGRSASDRCRLLL